MATDNKHINRFYELTTNFTWDVRNAIPRQTDNIHFSNSFCCPEYKAIQWRLEYVPSTGLGMYSEIILCLVSSDTLSFNSVYEWWVQDKNKKIVEGSKNGAHRFDKVGEKASIGTIHLKRQISHETIVLQMKVYVKEPPSDVKAEVPTTSLLDGIQSLLVKGLFKDLTLCVGEKKLKTHKLVVAARSPVLAAMMVGKPGCDELHIPHADFNVMRRIVHYMYTDQIVGIDRMADKIYPAACRFELLGLKTLCEDSMVKGLTVENAAQYLVLANDNPGDFKSRVRGFVESHGTEVLATAGFKSLAVDHTQLFLELYCAVNGLGAAKIGHAAG